MLIYLVSGVRIHAGAEEATVTVSSPERALRRSRSAIYRLLERPG